MSKYICPYCKANVGYKDKLKPLYSFRSQFVHCPSCNRRVSDFWVKAGLAVGMSGFGAAYFAMRAGDHSYAALVVVLAIYIAIFLLLPTVFGLRECEHIDADAIRKQRISEEMKINGGRILLLVSIGLALLLVLPWLL